jgi:hypothetical protein
MKIIHFTTVHPRTDTRIRVKEAVSIATTINANLSLYVQDGKESERDKASGIPIVNTGSKIENRIARMTKGSFRMLQAIRRAQPDVAHFHDPELIPVGLALKLLGIKVVYDVHENVPEIIMKRDYIPVWIRKAISFSMAGLEKAAARVFNRIVVVTPAIGRRFPGHKTVLVQNFPIKKELISIHSKPYEDRPADFAYVGGLTRERSAVEMVRALSCINYEIEVKLHIAGNFRPKELKNEIKNIDGWNSVVFYDWVDRCETANILSQARAGLVLFHPAPNHLDSQPNKLFEYMSAGLPVIASDFPLWRKIVEGSDCGLLVNPQDPTAIAQAMKWILDNPQKARQMGENGKRAVEEIYNWETESRKLIAMYDELIADDSKQERMQVL